MSDLNQCNFTGRLIASCYQSFTPSGASCTKFKIAVNDGYKDKATGEWKSTAEYINITAWRKDYLADKLAKGVQVRVTGKLKTDEYEKDGVKKYWTYINANEIQLLGGRGDSVPNAPESRPSDDDSIPF